NQVLPSTETKRSNARVGEIVPKRGIYQRTSAGAVVAGWGGHKKIREVLGPNGEDAVYLVSLTWESLGVLVFRHEVTLDLVDDFFSGPIVLSWQKLKVYSEEWRRTLNRETGNEWFHWLAERMMEREKLSPPAPAYVAHRTWREPPRPLARDTSTASDSR